MNRLLHLDRTLDELDPPRWEESAASEATPLVRKVHALRRMRLGELTPADLRTLVSQQVGLPFVLPLAVRLLLDEPLLDAYFYEGDLLFAVVSVPESSWAVFPDLAGSLRTVILALPDNAVDSMPPGAAEQLARFTHRQVGH